MASPRERAWWSSGLWTGYAVVWGLTWLVSMFGDEPLWLIGALSLVALVIAICKVPPDKAARRSPGSADRYGDAW